MGVVAMKWRLRVYQGQHAFDDGIDAKTGGLNADGVFGRPQGGHRAIGIAGVASENLAQQTAQVNGNPFVFQLLITSLGTFLGTGR